MFANKFSTVISQLPVAIKIICIIMIVISTLRNGWLWILFTLIFLISLTPRFSKLKLSSPSIKHTLSSENIKWTLGRIGLSWLAFSSCTLAAGSYTPVPRWRHTMTRIGTKMWVIGGTTGRIGTHSCIFSIIDII